MPKPTRLMFGQEGDEVIFCFANEPDAATFAKEELEGCCDYKIVGMAITVKTQSLQEMGFQLKLE